MSASAQKIVNRPAVPLLARQPVHVRSTPGVVQPAGSLKVSSPADPAEREAEHTARRIMRMPLPQSGSTITAKCSPHAARFADTIRQSEPPCIARKQEGTAAKSSSVASEISASRSSGQPLPSGVRRFMEPRFNADFSQVRIHTGEKAARLSRQVSAQAFTVGKQVFFGRDRFRPESNEGRELIAHELTHTIQQGAAIQRSADPSAVTQRTEPLIQRGLLSALGIDLDPRSYFADKAAAIPGFTMLTVVIGFNPITGASVDRSAGNILRGAIEMIPVAGVHISGALNNHGIFDKVSVWAAGQFKALSDIGSSIRQSVSDFIRDFDITSPLKMLERGKQLIAEPVSRIKNFAINLKDGIVAFVKDAILKPIAAFAKANAPNGYDLLCGVLGKDPISGEPVARSAETLIGPFMKLIGQEEVWENMKKANAIARAWAWFQNALGAVKGFVQQVPALFIAAFKSLEIIDIVFLPKAFAKLAGVFGGFVGKFAAWAGNAVWNLLEIIFDSVKPGLMGYIKKTGAALKSILKNPLPFVGNLVKAAKLGFESFASNFGQHFKAGLIDWLTGSLVGVYIPKALSLPELGKFALSVLGISWVRIRGKIVKVLGANGEMIMKGLETAFDVVKALVTGGPAAAWELIKEKLNELKDTVINGIIGFVTETVIMKAVPKLIAMFIPGAGFISAIISIYDTIMVFVQKISKIIQVVVAFIDSIVAIAGGNITAAARRVESILGGLLSLAISFLAGFLGLGKITDKIKGVIDKIRDKVDKAIDSAIAWIVAKAKALFGKLFGQGKKDERSPQEKERDVELAKADADKLISQENISLDQVKAGLKPIKTKYRLTRIDLEKQGKDDFHINVEINPKRKTKDYPFLEDAEAAHAHVMGEMSESNKKLLKGHGAHAAGRAGREFSDAEFDSVDDIGYVSWDHSSPGIKHPGTTTIRPKTKYGKMNKPNWIPDHQPPDTLNSGGATGLVFRFYPHSQTSARQQGGAVRVYKMWMKKVRKKGDSNWSKGIKSEWFW